mmetsp:Transcript_23038/g.17474  ORF Transcript_23038/g.17474 Transcript_23038/m.17474 type:complete len:89 (+) Transcript_23038:335-601(+)|eukprot:CAMPEP_0202968726 /NCGR_PEP_ID=MMETSP1396-20130829/14145_1 /ASSEMBLY_ACC=CAM_ASM_000872 /TAXON_ID= /ORGANISM="Pseudokeronopsis sp., Strain Brazil" /LENGTH=88 /DNA_ID=CAMNT_0049695375 /DNA_START=300 /DNA_END=566 /DNA_ORIENTATION=+
MFSKDLPEYNKEFGKARQEVKKDWVKASFWAPENTPKVDQDLIQKPSKHLSCPVADHKLKMKELISLKLEENEHKQFVCGVCKAALGH